MRIVRDFDRQIPFGMYRGYTVELRALGAGEKSSLDLRNEIGRITTDAELLAFVASRCNEYTQKWLGLLGQVLGLLKWIPCGLRLADSATKPVCALKQSHSGDSKEQRPRRSSDERGLGHTGGVVRTFL